MAEVKVNQVYELYQIMTDFGDPLEIFREGIQNAFDENASEIYIKVYEEKSLKTVKDIVIDIIDNGNGLAEKKIANFFDVANSTKIEENFVQKDGKHGYKGHGAKVFFNAKKIQICSKVKGEEPWAAELVEPIDQIEKNKKLEYTIIDSKELRASFPSSFESGFIVRIKAPNYFSEQDTRYKLSHIYLRDYCKWYTLAGTLESRYDEAIKDKTLYVQGLNIEEFSNKYNDKKICDPIPDVISIDKEKYERIPFGHYFPPTRTGKGMSKYAKDIESNKADYLFYSKIVHDEVHTVSGISFRLIISFEGYETKRRYDLLLTRQGQQSKQENHTDSHRYGLWACKGGVPVEKVDDWIEGGKGVGTYSYMQAFIDSDAFLLTANRGSIMNTDIQKLRIIKDEVNKVFKSSSVKNAMDEREELEKNYKAEISIKEDASNLSKRYNSSRAKKHIIFPDKTEILEPSCKNGYYNESETFAVLLAIMYRYPRLFDFKLLDYNTTKGIDFVIEDATGVPKYVELKGTLYKEINHPFQCVDRFICYDIAIDPNDTVEDINPEPKKAKLQINENDIFHSDDKDYDGIPCKSYILTPLTRGFTSMEVICLKDILLNVLGAEIK